jgi:nuclear GTP-binding protein
MPKKRSKSNTEAINKILAKRANPGRSNSGTNPNRKLDQIGGAALNRSKSTIKMLNLRRAKPDYSKMHEKALQPNRIEPDRKWFGNVRTIDQKELDKYKTELDQYEKDPYTFTLKKHKIDLSMFAKSGLYKRNKLTDVETFADTFGPKMKRVKPKILTESVEALAERVNQLEEKYDVNKDSNIHEKKLELQNAPKFNEDKRIEAGQSKRIWAELYKVLDSSDVICCILDARNPNGTRSYHVEKHLENNKKFKHLIYVLNKTDLVPTSVTSRWVKYLSQFHPTVAFKADINHPFGREALMNLLRQFDNFHKDKKTISIGFIGYPNTGKSSVINTLSKKAVCKSAPVPGETRVWQYITLTKRIYLIDCPGIVYDADNDGDTELVLKGVARAEKLKEPDFYVEAILQEVKPEVLQEVYGVGPFIDCDDFLRKVAIKLGRLLKHSEPDTVAAAKRILLDWQIGQIPHFKLPPNDKPKEEETAE